MKYLALSLVMVSAISCSHKSKETYRESIWQASIDKNSKRNPASTNKIPGYEAFISALKGSKAFYQAPVGEEIQRQFTDMREGGKPEINKTVYLKQTDYGVFSLQERAGRDDLQLEGHDVKTAASMEKEMKQMIESGIVKSYTQLNPNKFVLKFTINENFFCDSYFDFNEYDSRETRCEDSKKNLIWENKVISRNKVDLKQFENKLRNTSILLFSNIVKEDDGSIHGVKGEREDDWWKFLFEQTAENDEKK